MYGTAQLIAIRIGHRFDTLCHLIDLQIHERTCVFRSAFFLEDTLSNTNFLTSDIHSNTQDTYLHAKDMAGRSGCSANVEVRRLNASWPWKSLLSDPCESQQMRKVALDFKHLFGRRCQEFAEHTFSLSFLAKGTLLSQNFRLRFLNADEILLPALFAVYLSRFPTTIMLQHALEDNIESWGTISLSWL